MKNKMLCRLCLLECDDLIDIFDKQGRDLNISSVVEQHFGFELRSDDRISKKICSTCWLEIENFHVFFVDIQRAQEKLYSAIKCELSKEKVGVISNSKENVDSVHQDLSNVSGNIDVFAAPSTTYRYGVSKSKKVSISLDKSSPDVVVVDIETPEYNSIDKYDRDEDECTPIEFCTVDYDEHEEEEFFNTNYEELPDLCKILQRDEISITPIPDFSKVEPEDIKDDEKIRKYMKMKCDQCGSQFEIFSELKQHFRSVHKTSGYVVCCNQKFFKRIQLMEHIMKHVNPDIFRLPANTLCAVKKPTSDKSFLKICRYCRRIFRSKKQYEAHAREHNANKSSRIQCKQCSLWFKSKHSLQKHLKFHIDQSINFTCSLCGRQTISDIALYRHILNVHYRERKYQCVLCGKAFKWSINLKEHIAIHTGESLYKCPYCPKRFNASSNLHSHRKKLHRLEWEKERIERLGAESRKRVDSSEQI